MKISELNDVDASDSRVELYVCNLESDRSIPDGDTKENEPNHFTKAFNKENLSDCGISDSMLQLFCSPDPAAVHPLDSIKYNTEDDTYTW